MRSLSQQMMRNIALGCLTAAAIATPGHTAIPCSVATSGEVADFCGSTNVKIVFGLPQSGGLFYIDWSETSGDDRPVLHPIPGTERARFPMLSPDGKWVTYATGVMDEFSSDPSTAWLQPLSETGSAVKIAEYAYVPRFVNTNTEVAVVYGTCGQPHGCSYTWQGCGQTVKAIYNAGVFKTDVIGAQGSYLSGLSVDGRYLGHAQQAPYGFVLDLQGASGRPGVVHALTGVNKQVCNGSISQSRLYSDALLYLDFGSSRSVPAELGNPWKFHQRLFISRENGNLARYYLCPPIRVTPGDSIVGNGEVTNIAWGYPEWTNHPYYAVATVDIDRAYLVNGVWNSPEYSKHEAVYLIDLRDGRSLRLAGTADTSTSSPINFYNPHGWISVEPGFVEQAGWLDPPIAVPSAANRAAITDTVCSAQQPIDSTRQDNPPASKGRCGSGSVLALLPPMLIKAMRRKPLPKRAQSTGN